MAKKIVAIVGTCRKGKIIDTAVSEILCGAQALHVDGLAETSESALSEKARRRARRAGERLATRDA